MPTCEKERNPGHERSSEAMGPEPSQSLIANSQSNKSVFTGTRESRKRAPQSEPVYPCAALRLCTLDPLRLRCNNRPKCSPKLGLKAEAEPPTTDIVMLLAITPSGRCSRTEPNRRLCHHSSLLIGVLWRQGRDERGQSRDFLLGDCYRSGCTIAMTGGL